MKLNADLEYRIQIIYFECWEGLNGERWEENPSLAENIIKAIFECGLKSSLEDLAMAGMGLECYYDYWNKKFQTEFFT